MWAYSISAVKQDVFDDVDEEARALNAATNERPLPGPSHRLAGAAGVVAGDTPRETERAAVLPVREAHLSSRPRGLLLAALGDRLPWLFEPIHKTMVWGAPPVDHIGRIEDKVSVFWKR